MLLKNVALSARETHVWFLTVMDTKLKQSVGVSQHIIWLLTSEGSKITTNMTTYFAIAKLMQ